MQEKHSEAVLVGVIACPPTFMLKSNFGHPEEDVSFGGWLSCEWNQCSCYELGLGTKAEGSNCLAVSSSMWKYSTCPPGSCRTGCLFGGGEVISPHTKAPETLIVEFLSPCEANISLLVNKPFCARTKTKRSHYHLVIFLFMITTGETWTKYCSVSICNFFNY